MKLPRKYVDKKPKPLFRGILHGVFSIVFFLLYTTNDKLSLLYFGKFISYFASAFFHLYPFTERKNALRALKLDMIAIPINMHLNIIPFCTLNEKNHNLLLCIVFTILQIIVVNWQFTASKDYSLETPKGTSEHPRGILLIIQFIYVMLFIGCKMNFSNLWILNVILYCSAFILSIPVTMNHLEEPCYPEILPWHTKCMYSLHEDFHLLLLIADFLMIFNACSFVI